MSHSGPSMAATVLVASSPCAWGGINISRPREAQVSPQTELMGQHCLVSLMSHDPRLLQGLGSQGHTGVRPLLMGVPFPGDTKLPCVGREGTEPTPLLCGTCRVGCHRKGGHTWVEGGPSGWANVCRHPTHLLSSRLLVYGCHP